MSAARHLAVAATEAEVLREEIAEIGRQIDHRTFAPPGTAERGVWFWYWPPESVHSVDVITRLHADAVTFLHSLTNTQKEIS